MNRIGNVRGNSMVENLVGMTVFSFMAAALATSTVASIKANQTSRDAAAATALVHNWIEERRGEQPWVTATLQDGSESGLSALDQPAANGKFTRRWTVDHDTPLEGTTSVEVTVSWNKPRPGEASAVAYLCSTPTCS